jgi:hypothetical protein
MKRIFIFILASNLSMNALFSAQTGKTGLVFLKLGVDARALGLGETYTAFTNTPAGTYYNPRINIKYIRFTIINYAQGMDSGHKS